MAGWDTPPTPEELKSAGWDTPPTRKELARAAPPTTKVESAARGGFQGLSLGFGDEASAGLAALIPALDPEAAKGGTVGERYRNARDFYRGLNTTAEQSNPKTYLASQVVGGAAPTLIGAPPVAAGGRALLSAAGQGAAAGAGYSEANDARGLISDTALGAGLGTAGYGAGKVAGQGLSWVRGKGAALANKARGRAAQEGAEAATAPVMSLEGSARERAANAYRQMERINLALADPALPAAERAAILAFKESPEYADLLIINAKGILSAAPDAAAELAAARQIAADARNALPGEIQRETAARLVPQKAADARSFLKSYAEPVAWGLAGAGAANMAGMDPTSQAIAGSVMGAIGGRTRAGKALMTRLNRPAHQLARAEWMQNTATNLDPMVQAMLRRATPATIASVLATKENEP
jgi:hypothetical protein